MRTAGIYLHIPFCARKCGYCDFNAYSGYKEGTKARYVDALCAEIERQAESAIIPTVFFGGGTPTQLSALDLVRILDTLRSRFSVTVDAEITVEANPSDVDMAYLATLRAAGFNRLSFGVQTFNDSLLKTIDRLHTAQDAERAVAAARAAVFENISLDLMFALPRQTLSDWERTLESALALDVPHLSIYALILEEGTPFFARHKRGKLHFPSEKVEVGMFARAIERTKAAGLFQYEIGNYARPGFESRHNALYWRNEEYYGFGAGAVGFLDGLRRTNIRRPSDYIDAVFAGSSLIAESETLSRSDRMGETLMLALRMRSGIDLEAFSDRFGVRAEEQYADVIARHLASGLLEREGKHLRLTERGVFLANEVMVDFLP